MRSRYANKRRTRGVKRRRRRRTDKGGQASATLGLRFRMVSLTLSFSSVTPRERAIGGRCLFDVHKVFRGAFISWSKLLFVFSIGWLMNVMFVSSLCILTLGLCSRFYNDFYSVKEEPKWSSKLNFIWAPLWRLNWGHTLWRGVWSQSRTQSGVCCDWWMRLWMIIYV